MVGELSERYQADLFKDVKTAKTMQQEIFEGVMLTDEEIKLLLNDISITTFETRDQQEVIGYYETLSVILDNYDTIPITENYLKQLHKMLLNKSDKDTRHRGDYKTSSNTVTAKYPDGTEKIIFNTTDPFLVQKEMADLIKQF